VSTPFVTDYYAGDRSNWQLTDPAGIAVTPPASNKNTYYRETTVGTREQLYQFDQNPDSILPPGTTHFVTQVLLDPFLGNFSDYIKHLERVGTAEEAIESLASKNAAWIFRDGFYAVPTSPNQLEVRTLGGKAVWRATVNPNNGRESYESLGPTQSNFRINDDVWKDFQLRERESLELEDKLLGSQRSPGTPAGLHGAQPRSPL
jgi:hypothetical protein